MTEYGAGSVTRGPGQLDIGPNRMRREGEQLVIEIDDRSPWTGRRVRGRVRLHIPSPTGARQVLDDQGRHRWYPIAPRVPVEVELDAPNLRFVGHAYHDANEGDEGLEDAFTDWDWCRIDRGDAAEIIYDTRTVSGVERRLALRIRDGQLSALSLPEAPPLELPQTRWGLAPHTRAEIGTELTMRMPLEDTPFYARTLLDLKGPRGEAHLVHEHLDMRRFVRPTTQFMLPWRTRRVR